MRLQQEKSMRIVLERAMGRASSTLSPGHRHFAAQVIKKMLLNFPAAYYLFLFSHDIVPFGVCFIAFMSLNIGECFSS